VSDPARAAAALTPEQRELLRRRLARAQGARPSAPADAILPRPRDAGEPPLSWAQEELWQLDQADPGNPVFNILYPVRLRGPLAAAALSRALDEVVRRHESLRTTFPAVAGHPVQRVHAAADGHLRTEELREPDPSRRDAALRARCTAEAARRLDLRDGPLFSVTLVRLDAEDHALLLLVHHIVADGWSLSVLFRELAALYDAFRRGLPSPLPEPRLQFADWAVWQREHFDGERGEGLVEWWRRELAGAPPVLRLPTDRPRPASLVHRGASHPFRVPAAVAERLRALGREEGATPFMALLAVLDLVLHRWTGAEDFVVATPVANRTRVEAEALVGYMINTLAIRGRLGGDPPFRELLRRVRESVSGAFAHQELPFEALVARVRPDIRPTHHPVYQVMLVLQNATGELHLPGLRTGLLPADRSWAEVDVTLHVVEQGDGSLWCGFEYSVELFDPSTVARLAAHFRRLAEAAAAAPDTRISALPLLAPEEERRLAEWNATDAPRPAGICTHHLFESHARAAPAAIALRFPGGEMTYGELDRRADRLARRLRARGVRPETSVGVCLERSPEMVIALLAVLKAGGAFIPLDPSDPPLRLRQLLATAGAGLVFTDTPLAGALSGAAEPLIVEMRDGDEETGDDAAPLDADVDPRNLAIVICTSGPGAPVTIAVPHDALANAAAALPQLLDLRPGDRWLQLASSASDARVLEMVAALASGAALVLPPRESLVSPAALARLLAAEEITHALLPPSLLAEMPAVALPELRVLCVAGEPCPAELVDRWAPGRALVNLHGAAETTLVATAAHLREGAGKPPIGSPIANLRAHVVEAGLRLLPVGVAGELCIGGDGVARGYLHRPALTAERFVPDPFSPRPGARLFRTGDVARWTPEGELEILGRSDARLTVRGLRIEPAEVETVLRSHPAVAEAAVVAREMAGERRLVAFVVPAALPADERHAPGPYGYAPVSLRHVDDAALAASLRAHLAGRLPAYLLPAAIHLVAGLPRTVGGAPDRMALPGAAPEDPHPARPTPETQDLSAGPPPGSFVAIQSRGEPCGIP
jgi:amino acid adenylation domain-containing protein